MISLHTLADAVHISVFSQKCLILHIPDAAEIPLLPVCQSLAPSRDMLTSMPHVPWKVHSFSMDKRAHTNEYTHKHTVHGERQGCAMCKIVAQTTHTTKGLPRLQLRQRSSVNWELFCSLWETITCLSALFSLFSTLLSFALPIPAPFYPFLPHLQDDHLWPLHHAPRGRACVVDHDVWSVGEEPALRSLHEGALPADGAGLQESVECLLILAPSLPSDIKKCCKSSKGWHKWSQVCQNPV